ncbi:hypothetical protein CYFUS_004501 [Cystobacter fuscus]|uniref:Polyketide cyclase n=1 Tax=Cystobacter fuscus TaxID=43 RepID=A0A250J6F7_9BACT|nr:SRPBCC family protein [Cystobacter fuscus]ATB39062.1 hypothetical protein CYFUS_004501 [Cystobacter fuscus]
MLKKILLGLAVVIVALFGVIATRPSTYSVQRSATFKAPPDVAFALVNDFHQWGGWLPWNALDPSQKTTFEGAPMGEGARYGWSGNDQVGEGRMLIEESKPNELVRIQLEFIRPFASTTRTTFTFKPAAEGVEVTWAMSGEDNFMGKAFSLVVDRDAMLGKDFDKGLAAMKTLAEAEAGKRAEAEAAKLAAEKVAAPVEAPPAAEGGQAVAAPTP